MERVPQVEKLLNLKRWLTVPDAARHLSILFGEDVTEADVLHLALEGHLTLSVDFVNHTTGRCGPTIPLQDAKRRRVKSPLNKEWIDLVEGLEVGDQVIQLGKQVVSLEGIWDLKMQGAERIDVEHRYQFLTGGPSVELNNLTGVIVCREDGTHCQLQSHFSDNPENLKKPSNHSDNYHPAGGLPDDCVLVVKTSALHDLEARQSEPDQKAERPLGQRERDTLLVIIASLADLPKVDVKKHSKAALAIQSQAAGMGVRVGARTIEDHLKRIPDALEKFKQ
jgi:hypothetical protein